eukprot:TRINITY_DN3143_c4_g1_i1.p1 TRINITY_DN3143_c4_g1~~TRINITY_DN3143_c4_g1_i1.p1  ORF type:complete len:580 (-),score=175.11 TRINITY_DN3143_c4_g1_i1:603-2342(-)
MNEDEDHVVEEYDVFLNQDLLEELSLLQFPLKSKQYPPDFSKIDEVQYKPKNKMLNFNMKVEHENEMMMENYDYESIKIPPKVNYAVGVLKNKSFYLTYLEDIYQMRPKLKTRNENQGQFEEEDEMLNDMENEQIIDHTRSDDSIINRKLKAKEQSKEKIKIVRKKSKYLRMIDKQNEEDFIALDSDFKNWHTGIRQFDTVQQAKFNRLIACNDVEVACEQNNYLDTLLPVVSSKPVPMKLSMRLLNELPLENRIAEIMMKLNVIDYQQLCGLLKFGDNKLVPPPFVIEALDHSTVLVQGNLVISTKILEERTILPRGRVGIVRDFILSRLNAEGVIQIEEITDLFPIDRRDIMSILSPMTIMNDDGSYKLKKDRNQQFIDENSEFVEKFENFWDNFDRMLKEKLERVHLSESIKKTDDGFYTNANYTEDNMEVNNDLKNFIVSIFYSYQEVLSKASILKLLRREGFKINPTRITEIELYLEEICHKFGDSYVLKKIEKQFLASHYIDDLEYYNSIRDVILELLLQNNNSGIRRINVIKGLKKKFSNFEERQYDKIPKQILHSLCVSNNAKWFLRPGKI